MEGYVFSSGIIPTRVGTSILIDEIGTILKDHPHACGDKKQLFFSGSFLTGSSPRVWGQAVRFYLTVDKCRIIPTRVGTSSSDKSNCRGKRDHPHACGDKSSTTGNRSAKLGSSPRVWGQVNLHAFSPRFQGIIPTRVGTSCY